jgi:hypothetical protein
MFAAVCALAVKIEEVFCMAKKKKSIIPGLSMSRALGISKVKQDIARATGIPTTKQGRKRKLEHEVFKILTNK